MSYVAIASQTLAATASSVTFSSITGAYRDLVLIAHFTTTSSTTMKLFFNSDTTDANYKVVAMSSVNSSRSATTASQASINLGALTSGATCMLVVNIMDYAQSKHKTTLSRFGNYPNGNQASAHTWENTSAVTTIDLSLVAGSFNVGGTFSLYGISA